MGYTSPRLTENYNLSIVKSIERLMHRFYLIAYELFCLCFLIIRSYSAGCNRIFRKKADFASFSVDTFWKLIVLLLSSVMLEISQKSGITILDF